MKKIAAIAVIALVAASANAQVSALFTGRQLQMGYDRVQCEYQYLGMYYYFTFKGYYCPAMVEI